MRRPISDAKPTSVLRPLARAAAVLLYAGVLGGVKIRRSLWAHGTAGGRLVSGRISPRFARRVVALHGTPVVAVCWAIWLRWLALRF